VERRAAKEEIAGSQQGDQDSDGGDDDGDNKNNASCHPPQTIPAATQEESIY